MPAGKYFEYIRDENFNIVDWILLFMVALYPLIVLPDPITHLFSLSEVMHPNYFLGPRYIILAAVSLVSLYIIVKGKMISYHPVLLPLTFFILFATISAVLAQDNLTAWMGSPLRFTGVLTYYFCIVLFFLAQRSVHAGKLLNYIIIAAGVVSLTAVLQYFGLNIVPHDPFWDGYISYGTMGHPNFLGNYISFILPAAVLKYINSKNFPWLILSGIIYTGLLVSLTRGAWIAFFVVMVVIGIYTFNKLFQRQLFAKIILMFVLITIVMFPMRNGTLMNRFVSVTSEKGVGVSDSSGMYRVYAWKETTKLFLDNWLFGIGPDHIVFANIIKPDDSYHFDKAHNIYLEIAATMGILALISFIIFLSYFFRDYKNDKTFILKMMVLAYLLHGIFTMEVIMIMPIFWIVLGLYIATQNVEKEMLT